MLKADNLGLIVFFMTFIVFSGMYYSAGIPLNWEYLVLLLPAAITGGITWSLLFSAEDTKKNLASAESRRLLVDKLSLKLDELGDKMSPGVPRNYIIAFFGVTRMITDRLGLGRWLARSDMDQLKAAMAAHRVWASAVANTSFDDCTKGQVVHVLNILDSLLDGKLDGLEDKIERIGGDL